MLQKNKFLFYDENEEKENGMYWEFINATDEELNDADIDFFYIREIIIKIKDSELRSKMINRAYMLLMNKDFSRSGEIVTLDIFTEEQKCKIAEKETTYICERILNEMDTEDLAIRQRIYNIIGQEIELILWQEDDENTYKQLIKIFQSLNGKLKTEDIIKKLNTKFVYEIYRRRPELAKKIMKSNIRVSEEFLKFIEIENDRGYMQRKAEQILDRKPEIGIDSRISLGLEIEANNDLDIEFSISSQREYENYIIKQDATVVPGREVVCPPFHDEPTEVAKICALCEAMQEMGFYYDETRENTAGQINIGLDYLDTARAVENFYEIFGNCEELLFHISNKEGQLTRQSVYANSRFKPISEIIGERVVDEDISRNELLRLLYVPFSSYGEMKMHIEELRYKKNTVCIRDMLDRNRARIEIRIPNGSTEYQVWIDNIRLYGKLVEISRRLAEIEAKKEITEEEERLLWLKEDLADPRNTLEDKLYTLMDLLFGDDEIKQIYVDRFYTLQQRIKDTGTTKYKVDSELRRTTGEKAFGIVDFQEQYNSRRSRGVISYDPETGIYSENGREEEM